MLIELYLLRTYFAEQFSALYEQDLVSRYGRKAVSEAIREGVLEHSFVPCGRNRRRCVCRLSEKGLRQAQAAISGTVQFRTVF